jgi:restriction system protein
MSVPVFYRFIDPVLRVLAEASSPMHRRDIVEMAVARMNLSEQDLAELAGWRGTGRGVTKARDRAAWAITYANKGDWVHNASRGHWELTPAGRALLKKYPKGIPDEVFHELLAQVRDERKQRQRASSDEAVVIEEEEVELSPEEQIHAAYLRLRADVGAALLSNLRAAEPSFLEKTVIQLLGAMGYGADPEALVVTGASGDGGIDGIVRLDRLGLEHIYVQAKRHDANNKVQRKDIQAFLGALTERNANKGVFITTSDFASGARDFADRREGIVLINGEKLAELMIDHGVGVQRRQTIEIVRIEDTFFEEA